MADDSKKKSEQTIADATAEKQRLEQVRHWQEHRLERRRRRFLRKHLDQAGQPKPSSWRQGVESLKRMKVAGGLRRALAAKPAPSVTGVVGLLWTQIGPAPLIIDQEKNFQGLGPDSGEVVDIAIDPSGATDQTIYVATNDGGIWKTTDGGNTWVPKTEFMPSLSMGAVALDPSNPSIVYVGTGNLFDGGARFSKIAGVYQSIDGGETWSILPPAPAPAGSFFSTNGVNGINRIVVLPGGVLLVATDKGLFRSPDAGQTFAEVPLGPNAITGGFISSLNVHTGSQSIVFASVSGQGVFQSVDSGTTFPVNLFVDAGGNPRAGAPTAPFAAITFAQSTLAGGVANSQTMYASIQGSPQGYKGLFKSTDGGTTWTVMPDANTRALENGDQVGYDRTLGVDPQDPNRVYIGFQEVYVSTNGGTLFTKFSGGSTPVTATPSKIHWDNHALVFSPRSHQGAAPTQFYVGTDGGIATNPNGNVNNWTNLNGPSGTGAIASNLLVGIDIGRGSVANNAFTYGGCQDTGLDGRRQGDQGLDWHLAVDGDGGPVVVDRSNPRNVYGSTNAFYALTTDGGNNWSRPAPGATGLPAGAPPFQGSSLGQPLAVDSNNSSVVYVASGSQTPQGASIFNRLFRSVNSGVSFAAVPNFVTGANNIVSLATTPQDSDRLWAGMDDGSVQFTSNATAGAAANWSAPPNSPGPNVPVGAVAIDPGNKNQVVVVYGGGGPQQRVFLTSDSGNSAWQDITGNIDPNLVLNSVVIDSTTNPSTIVVGTTGAVLVTTNTGTSWQLLGVGLPNVDCTSLALDHQANQPSLLRVGTYGRSVFELTAPTGPQIFVKANLAFGVVPLNTLSGQQTVQIFNVGDQDLHIASFALSSGSADFQAPSGPAFPATVSPGAEIDYTVQFQPSTNGIQTALYQIQSDDPSQPSVSVHASGMTAPTPSPSPSPTPSPSPSPTPSPSPSPTPSPSPSPTPSPSPSPTPSPSPSPTPSPSPSPTPSPSPSPTPSPSPSPTPSPSPSPTPSPSPSPTPSPSPSPTPSPSPSPTPSPSPSPTPSPSPSPTPSPSPSPTPSPSPSPTPSPVPPAPVRLRSGRFKTKRRR